MKKRLLLKRDMRVIGDAPAEIDLPILIGDILGEHLEQLRDPRSWEMFQRCAERLGLALHDQRSERLHHIGSFGKLGDNLIDNLPRRAVFPIMGGRRRHRRMNGGRLIPIGCFVFECRLRLIERGFRFAVGDTENVAPLQSSGMLEEGLHMAESGGEMAELGFEIVDLAIAAFQEFLLPLHHAIEFLKVGGKLPILGVTLARQIVGFLNTGFQIGDFLL
jgi:hypothetical protein